MLGVVGKILVEVGQAIGVLAQLRINDSQVVTCCHLPTLTSNPHETIGSRTLLWEVCHVINPAKLLTCLVLGNSGSISVVNADELRQAHINGAWLPAVFA